MAMCPFLKIYTKMKITPPFCTGRVLTCQHLRDANNFNIPIDVSAWHGKKR